MTLSLDQTIFRQFLDTFPARDEPHDENAAREAWTRAVERADPDAILAGAKAYRKAREGQPARYTMTARRWLQESRWRDAGPVSGPPVKAQTGLVWIEYGKPEWDAWTQFRGRTPPMDRRGGWWFPSRLPPSLQAAE